MINYTYNTTDAKFYEAVYDLLMEKAGAPKNPYDKMTFVQSFTQVEHPTQEYRCCFALGFGGKFWRNDRRVYVSYYHEDKTDKRDKIRDEVNAALAVLVETYKPNLSKY